MTLRPVAESECHLLAEAKRAYQADRQQPDTTEAATSQ
jgi:hypothetical protein